MGLHVRTHEATASSARRIPPPSLALFYLACLSVVKHGKGTLQGTYHTARFGRMYEPPDPHRAALVHRIPTLLLLYFIWHVSVFENKVKPYQV